jgi:MFS family permease
MSLVAASTTALPFIRRDFAVSVETSGWFAVAYLLVLTGLLPLAGSVTDRFGTRTSFVAGQLIFGAAALSVAISRSFVVCVALRIVQAIGGALTTVSVPTLGTDQLPLGERLKALGSHATVLFVTYLIAPPITQFVAEHASWRLLFLASAVMAFFVVGLSSFTVTADMDGRSRPRRVDLPSGLAALVAVASILWLIRYVAAHPWSTVHSASAVAIAAGAGLLFIAASLAAETATLDLQLMTHAQSVRSLVTALWHYAAISMANSFAPFYLNEDLQLSPTRCAALLICQPIGMLFGSLLSRPGVARFGRAASTTGGTIITTAGLLVLWYGHAAQPNFALGMLLTGVGSGIFAVPNTALVMEVAGTSSGGATALVNLARNLGITIGVSVTTALHGRVSVGVTMIAMIWFCGLAVVTSMLRRKARAAATGP